MSVGGQLAGIFQRCHDRRPRRVRRTGRRLYPQWLSSILFLLLVLPVFFWILIVCRRPHALAILYEPASRDSQRTLSMSAPPCIVQECVRSRFGLVMVDGGPCRHLPM